MANLVRRVRTPGGSRYFGLPIGAIITADARQAAKAKHGGKSAPKGSTSVRVGSEPFSGQKPTNTKKAATAQATEVAKAKEVLGTSGKAPGGPKSLVVNGTEHKFPEGTKVARSKGYPNRIAYAQTPDGRVFRMADEHIDEPEGEVKQGIAQAFNAGGNDLIDTPTDIDADSYDPLTDPNEAPYIDVADLDEGETLSNATGMKSFTKTGDNAWSDSKGFTIDDKKMQALVDLGSFGVGGKEIPDFIDEPTNLHELLGDDADVEDFAEYLDGLPNGQKATVAGSPYTKTEGNENADTWQNDEDENDVISNEDMAGLAPLVDLEPTPDENIASEEDEGVDSTLLEDESNGNAGDGEADGSAEAGESADAEGTSGDDSGAEGSTAEQDAASEPVEGTPVDRPARFDDLEAQGQNVVEVIETKDAARFQEAISSTKERLGALSSAVHVYDLEEYEDMRLFLDKDGKAGFALKGDDIVSVFNAHDPSDTSKKGIARSLIAQAVDQGGRRLDAFDDILPKIYAQEGFVPTSRMKWNDEFAPEGWDYDADAIKKLPNEGRPDVVFMAYDPDALDKKYGEHLEEGNGGDYFEDYDDAVAAQDAKVNGTDEESTEKTPVEQAQEEWEAANQAAIEANVKAAQTGYDDYDAKQAATKEKADTAKAADHAFKKLDAAKAAEAGDPLPMLEWERADAKNRISAAKGSAELAAAQKDFDDATEAIQQHKAGLEEAAKAEKAEADKSLTPLEKAQQDYDEAVEEKVQAEKAKSSIQSTQDATQKVQEAKAALDEAKAAAEADSGDYADPVEPEPVDETWQKTANDLANAPDAAGNATDLNEQNVSDASAEALSKDEDAALENHEEADTTPKAKNPAGISNDENNALDASLPEETAEVTDPKKVKALRDSFEEPWMAKESLIYGTGELTPEAIQDAPSGLILYSEEEGAEGEPAISKIVKLPNGMWFDGENGLTEQDLLDLLAAPDVVLDHPNNVNGFKGIANDVPAKKVKTKKDVSKTYGDNMVAQNKGKKFSVEKESNYGDHKFTAEADEDGNLTLAVNGTPLTTAEVKQAFTALNEHSSTHVTYALYQLPQDHPLAEKGLINQFRDTALLRYPSSKPKAAALLTLKEAGNIQDAPILHPKGKTILVGDFLNKSQNVQGPAYGFFTLDDLHDSISILEQTTEKMFKGTLTKNLNAVGNIDPSKIIHNEKDKHKNRAKFINYLKNVLDTSALVPTTEQYVARLDSLSEGHIVMTRQGRVYTKNAAGVWTNPDVDGALSSESLYATHKQALTFVSQSKTPLSEFSDSDRMAVIEGDSATLYKKNLQGLWIKVYEGNDELGEGGEKNSYTDANLQGLDTRKVFKFTTDNEDIVAYDTTTGEPVYHDAEAYAASIEKWMEDIDAVLHDDEDAPTDIVLTQKNVETDDPSYLAATAPGTAAAVTASAVADGEPETEIYIHNGAGLWVHEQRGAVPSDLLDSPAGTRMVVLSKGGLIKFVLRKNEDGTVTSRDQYGESPLSDKIVKFAFTRKNGYFIGPVATEDMLSSAPSGARVLADTTVGDSLGTLSSYMYFEKHNQMWHSDTGQIFYASELAEFGKTHLLQTSPQGEQAKPVLTSDEMIDNHETVVVESEPIKTSQIGDSTIAQASNEDYLQAETDKPDAIVPGKYTTANGGAAYMIVHDDGTGTYVNKAGDKKKLTANAVKKNYDSGMSTYHGTAEGSDTTKAAATPAEKKPQTQPVEDFQLDDGTYYIGDPNKASSTILVVEDGETKIYKPHVSVEAGGSKYKVGDYVHIPYSQNFPDQSEFRVSYGYYAKDEFKGYLTLKFEGDKAILRNADGKEMASFNKEEVTHAALVGVAYDDTVSEWSRQVSMTVQQIAEGKFLKPTKTSKAFLQKNFLGGAITDKYGNSILPEGHTGAQSIFGVMVDLPTLLDIKARLDSGDLDINNIGDAVSSKYFHSSTPQMLRMSQENLRAYAKDVDGVDEAAFNNSTQDLKAKQNAFLSHLAAVTEGVKVEIPTSDTAALFEYDSLGHPKKPLPTNPNEYGETLGYYSSTGMYSKYIKQISDTFGGGGIIGLHYGQMSKDNKVAWVNALNAGNFAAMYDIEMNAAAKKGQPHGSGYLHPGYKSNVETHKMQWGAAVEGEALAAETLEGDWSSNVNYASMEEINNYLIKANMQNPTHLSEAEKRAWVNGHRQHNQQYVDEFSVRALIRAKAGETPLSEPLVWTDDVQPGKSYNSLFDETPHPTKWGHHTADEYVADHPELLGAAQAWFSEQTGGDTLNSFDDLHYSKASFLNAHFSALKEEAYQLSLIPVYTRKEEQTLEDSANMTAEYTDQHGVEYIFKPRNLNSGKPAGYEEYRAEIEHAGNLLGRAFGLSTPASTLETLDTPGWGPSYGQMQKRLTNVVGNMKKKFDFGSMTKQMMVDVAVEHMFDYMTSQDDNHGGNSLITDKGRVIGIDKGRAFRDPGRWNGLSSYSKDLDTNALTVYSRMYGAIADGEYTKEELDAVYFAASARIRRMMKVNDEKLAAIIEDGVKNLPESYWNMSYATVDGQPVSNDVEGLKQFFFDRKNNLSERFDQLWLEIYGRAGHIGLPEKTDIPVEGIATSLTDDEYLEQVFANQAKGAVAQLANGQIKGSNVTTWTETTETGTPQVAAQFFLSEGKQKELVSLLEQHATPELKTSGAYASDVHWDSIYQGAKTVNGHAADGNYNQQRIASLTAARDKIAMDLAVAAEMQSKPATSLGGLPVKKFPSGIAVPETDVPQYILMLEKYDNDIKAIFDAKEAQTKVGHVAKYEPITTVPGEYYAHTNGTYIVPVKGEEKFLVWRDHGAVDVVGPDDEDVLSALNLGTGWTSSLTSSEKKPSFQVVKKDVTHEMGSTLDNDQKKVLGTIPATHYHGGSPGMEYEITLPTGERIYFRNAGSTGSVRSQQGKVVIHAPGASNPSEAQNALQTAADFLDSIDVDLTSPATEESLENTYWNEMFDFLQNRASKGGSWAKAQKKFREMAAEQGVNPDNYLDYLQGALELEERNEFWRSFYVEFFPQEIEELIESRGYLPRYSHMDPSNPESTGGKPTWLRFDWRDEYETILNSGKHMSKTARIMQSTDGIDTIFGGGGWLTAEEVFRKTGKFGNNAASPTSDQDNGATHFVWARSKKGLDNIGDSLTSWRMILHPSTALRARNYALKQDSYGSESQKKSSASPSLAADLKAHGGGGNEVLISEQLSILDDVELVVMPSAAMRDYIIQEFKKRGITEIRGIPVEERFVLSSGVQAAYDKIRETWKEWTPYED